MMSDSSNGRSQLSDRSDGREIRSSGPAVPTAPSERIATVDILRGVAVLGILVINIEYYALPSSTFFNPTLAGGFSGLNLLAWQFGALFCFEKMMAVFSMLFGAGLVLMWERTQAAGAPLGRVYYRRILWLLLIGLAHGYLLWYGDILFSYAICGLLLFLFRRRSARLLIILGACTLAVGILLQVATGTMQSWLRHQAETVAAAQAAGQPVQPWQEEVSATWAELQAIFEPSADELAKEVNAYRGSYSDALSARTPQTVMMQTQALALFVFWRAAGLMLLGMGLMKLGVFSGKRTPKFYVTMIVAGYGAGLPLVWYGMETLIDHGFDQIFRLQIGNHFNYVGSVLVALAHVGLVMIVCRKGAVSWLTRRLSAVGQLAFTNYLMQTIVCTTIFYGHGLGLFARLERLELVGVVLLVWVFQLLVSPLWLRKFRFGPAEWLWRSLTYWHRQPMRVHSGR